MTEILFFLSFILFFTTPAAMIFCLFKPKTVHDFTGFELNRKQILFYFSLVAFALFTITVLATPPSIIKTENVTDEVTNEPTTASEQSDQAQIAPSIPEVAGDKITIETPTLTPSPTLSQTPTSTPTVKIDPPTSTPTFYIPSIQEPWSCNCSKTCSQMSSCAEAQYQLNSCGCGRRDADNDGIACDSECQ